MPIMQVTGRWMMPQALKLELLRMRQSFRSNNP